MLKLLKRWLGWDDSPGTFDFDAIEKPKPRPATARVLTKGPRVRPTKTTVDLNRDPAGDESFDPYNTGKFDRGVSWERISRTHR